MLPASTTLTQIACEFRITAKYFALIAISPGAHTIVGKSVILSKRFREFDLHVYKKSEMIWKRERNEMRKLLEGGKNKKAAVDIL